MPRDAITRELRPLSASEAMQRHTLLVQYDDLGQQMSGSKDRFVFHYSNISGLRGILDSNAIWASDHRFLNDASEIQFGLLILEMLVPTRHGLGELIEPSLRAELGMALAMLCETRSSYVLSASFCKRANLLSQWRAYASIEGLAISFERTAVTQKAHEQGFVTGDVHYYFAGSAGQTGQSLDDWLRSRIECLNRLLSTSASQLREEASAHESHLVENLIKGQRRRLIDRWCLETAAFIKHPIFCEEAEWRCVKVIDRTKLPADEVQDRVSGARVIPYVELGLAERHERPLGISRIIVGPNRDATSIMHAVDHLFSARGLACGSVVAPFNPLRT